VSTVQVRLPSAVINLMQTQRKAGIEK